MLFKNLMIYRLPSPWYLSAAEIETRLGARTLQPCGAFDMTRHGWVPVLNGGRLLHSVNQQHMIALGTNQKLLPGSIVRQVAQERAEALATEQGFAVGRRQMRELRNQVADELRARALTRRTTTRAWIDVDGGWFIIEAAGATRAECVIETLSDTLDSFAPTPLDTTGVPHVIMSAWLARGEAAGRFAIDTDLELQSADKSKPVIRYVRHPLDGPEIRAHLAAAKYPTRLGLTWNDRISFVLTDKLAIKKLEFLELGNDEAQEDDLDPAERFDIEFTVMAGELKGLLTDLTTVLNAPIGAARWDVRDAAAA